MTGETMANGTTTEQNYAALSERVDNQGRMFNDFRANVDRQFANLGVTLTALDAKLDAQKTDIAAGRQTNWGSLITLLGGAVGLTITVVSVLGSLALQPTNNRLTRIEADFETQKSVTVPRNEIEKVDKVAEDRQNLLRDALITVRKDTVDKDTFKTAMDTTLREGEARSANNRAKIEAVGDRLDDLEKVIVKREEHTQHWVGVDQALLDKQRQIDEVKRQLEGLFPTSAFLKDLNDRTRQLEIEVLKQAAK